MLTSTFLFVVLGVQAMQNPQQPTMGLGALARPQPGRSMRSTSTFREGPDGKYLRTAKPKGDLEEKSNYDNFRVPPGETHTLLDVEGPGVITHIWITFLGPEPQGWAPNGSASHQDMLLRIYWDGNEKPAVEAPVGDFFANAFGKRSEVISLPIIVEDGDSYNSFWHMPFRKSARVEIVNQGEQNINLLYYNIDWIKLDSLPKIRLISMLSTGRNTRSNKARITSFWKQKARATWSASLWPSAPEVLRGLAKATKRSTSTARPSPRFGVPARRITSFLHGASKRPALRTSACRISINGALSAGTRAPIGGTSTTPSCFRKASR